MDDKQMFSLGLTKRPKMASRTGTNKRRCYVKRYIMGLIWN